MTLLEYLEAYGTHEGLLKAWDTRGRKGAEGFVSPNESEGMNFQQALGKLNSPEQKQFLQAAQGLLKQVAGKGEVKPAVGDWKDGAENSSVLMSTSANKDDMAYIVAKLGQMSNQKAVVCFARDKAGKDTVWSFEDGPNITEVRNALEKSGIEFRTLVPGAKTGVMVFDQGSALRNKITKVASQFGADVHFSKGTGAFIGGETREDGQKAYQEIISRYEAAHSIH